MNSRALACLLLTFACFGCCSPRVRGEFARPRSERIAAPTDYAPIGSQDGEKGIDATELWSWRDEVGERDERRRKESVVWASVSFTERLDCPRYCARRRPETHSGTGYVQRVNLVWSYIDASAETENSMENSLNLEVPYSELVEVKRNVSTDYCQIYFDIRCGALEQGFRENSFTNESTIEHSKILAGESEVNGYSEVKINTDQSDANIRLSIWGNPARAILDIPTRETADGYVPVVSLARTYDSEGVDVDVSGVPSGEWRMKLVGVENSKYSFVVVASNRTNTQTTMEGRASTDSTGQVSSEKWMWPSPPGTKDVAFSDNNKESEDTTRRGWKLIAERGLEDADTGKENNRLISIADFPPSIDDDSLVDAQNSFASENLSTSSSPDQRYGRILNRLSATALKETELYGDDVGDADSPTNISMRMVDTAENRELADVERLAEIAEDVGTKKRGITVELNTHSNLIVAPGTIHRIVFDVTNNNLEAVRCVFKVKSTHLRIYNLQPLYAWVYAGQTINVVVDVVVPRVIPQDTINTLTLFVENTDVKEKSVYLYVQGWVSQIADDVKPTIEYSFNNNCAGKLDKDVCAKSVWSADITVRDPDSGLKRVTSSPNELISRTDFVSGTRSAVTFYYSATCCHTTAKITATDLLDNSNTRTIDVTVWDNLSQAEIAAIIVGALLLLLLVILLIAGISYYCRRRKGQDLPYTQRYGSRPPARAERTSF